MAVAVVYVATAKLGLALSVAYGNVTPVWAPTGVALAALVLYGYRLVPGVALGAFVANVTTPIPVLAAGGIAAGNTLEAVVATYLLHRVGFRPQMDRLRDVLWLLLFSSFLSTTVSASVGTTTLRLAGEIPGPEWGFAWGLWWYGDALGSMIVGPLLLIWLTPAQGPKVDLRRRLEAGLLAAGLLVAGTIVFFGDQWRYPSLFFPFVIWAALRFRQRGATLTGAAIVLFAVAGTLAAARPISGWDLTQSVQILQLLTGITAVSGLILAATLTEREALEIVRSRTAEALSISEQRSRLILDTAGQAYVSIDAGGIIRDWNHEAERTFGWARSEVIGRSVAETLIPERHREIFDKGLAANSDLKESVVLASGYEARGLHRNGYEFPIDLTVWATVLGGEISFNAFVHDITERKRSEAFRDDFIANAAHELRTPLTTMIGFASILSEPGAGLSEAERTVATQGLDRSGQRLRMLVNNLLDMTRFREGKFVLHKEPVVVADRLARVLREYEPPEGYRVAVDVPDDTMVTADPGRFDQIVSNLLINAYRYGGRNIEVAAQRDGSTVVLKVVDDGPGITRNLENKLFDAFIRGDESAGKGSGLGLSIVRMLVDAHEGDVWYERGRPRGASFSVRLPRASAHRP